MQVTLFKSEKKLIIRKKEGVYAVENSDDFDDEVTFPLTIQTNIRYSSEKEIIKELADEYNVKIENIIVKEVDELWED